MSSIDSYEYDCTRKCKLSEHGHLITTALTKRSIADDKLAAYVAKICRNFAEVFDFEGRTALHLAASVGRYSIVEWLLNQGAAVNTKDLESGNSALHRALFYGCIDCAVLLLRYGANLELTDYDFRNPLQYICKPKELECYNEISASNETLVWGTNKNYNLGIGNDQGSSTPQSLDAFRKQDISVRHLSMSIYHTLYVDAAGSVYSVGHGKGGRLGTGSENSLPMPKRLKLPTRDPEEKAMSVSCSRNHSLILTNKGSVFTCGLNSHQQLGLQGSPIEKSIVLKEIVAFKQFGVQNLLGVTANDCYSLAYNSKELYVWGANCGQFGLRDDVKHIPLPRQIQLPENKKIQMVESNNFTIACYTTCKLIFLFHNYKMKSMKTPYLEPLICMSITGGNPKKDGKPDENADLKLLVLTNTNCVYIWHEDTLQYIRCIYIQARQFYVDKIILNNNQVLVLSQGDVFKGKISKQIIQNPIDITEYKDTYNKKEICMKSRIRIDLKRIPNIDRAVAIFADDSFESFTALQESSRKYYRVIDLPTEMNTFKTLLHEVSEQDAVHDIVFHVDNETFPAHRFIVFSRSKGIAAAVQILEDKNVYLNYKGLTGKMFEIALKHIYANYLPVDADLDEIHRSMGPEFRGDRVDAANIFLKFALKFELNDLAGEIRSLITDTVRQTKVRFPRLRRTALTELHDVKIICASNRELYAHKCVLVDRLEYFRLMFSNTWSETKTINLSTLPIEYMAPLIDFLYANDARIFEKETHSESFLYNMIVICDQFFVERFRRICERLILDRLSIRKCGEMLEFACDYNCDVLEAGCLQFICQNLARILEQRILESCSPEALARINQFYRKMYKHKLDFRLITPSSDAISDEDLIDFVADFSVDLEYKISENDLKAKTKTKTKVNKSAMSKRSYEQEAIMSMREANTNAEKSPNTSGEMKALVENISEFERKLHSEARNWTKVTEVKKDNRMKALLAAVKTNEIMKEEQKNVEIGQSPKVKLPEESPAKYQTIIPYSKTKPTAETTSPSPKSKLTAEITSQSPTSKLNLSFGEFIPVKGGKLSQKQRKKLSFESPPIAPTEPIAIPKTPNAWGTASNPSTPRSSFADIAKSPQAGESMSSPRRSQPSPGQNSFSETSKPKTIYEQTLATSKDVNSCKNSSFSKILEDERKQKEYFDKIKSKSLVLTQIEETAIAELEAFYNVDNVFDESIRIDRVRQMQTVNFSTWRHG